MRWPFSRPSPPAPTHARTPFMAHPAEDASEADSDEEAPFACSACGRTDLPETGDWSPPVCLECDAQLNFDAIEEVLWHE